VWFTFIFLHYLRENLDMMISTINLEKLSSNRHKLSLTLLMILSLSACVTPAPSEESGEVDQAVEEDRGSSPGFRFDSEPAEGDMTVDMMESTGGEDTPDMSPPEDLSCQECSDDECGEGSQCVTLDADGEDRRCFSTCDEGECDDGFECVTFAEGLEVCVQEDESTCSYCYDLDGDGHGVGPDCDSGRVDCDDTNAMIHFGVTDLCDGIDQDCDGTIDEDFTSTECTVSACRRESVCVEGVEMGCEPFTPSENDSTCDGIDDDCDGAYDEDYEQASCGVGLCGSTSSCTEGVEETCTPGEAQTIEDLLCDGIDDDCDGSTDEDFNDSCGEGRCVRFAVCLEGVSSCEPTAPDPLEQDISCNLIDEDCDGEVDEGFASIATTCGEGLCQQSATCGDDGTVSCTPTEPMVTEDLTCDAVDNDCDGEVDEECAVNTLRVVYNAAESMRTGSVAYDIFYDQLHSPTNDGTNTQPTSMELAIFSTIPPASNVEGVGFVRGSSTLSANKTVTPISGVGFVRYVFFGLGIEAGSALISPSDETLSRDGKLITLYYSNGSSLSWNTDLTSMANANATGGQALEARLDLLDFPNP
jgi:hypothetical protein